MKIAGKCFNNKIYSLLTLILFQILLRSLYWTVPFVLSVILSELIFFTSSFCYSDINM